MAGSGEGFEVLRRTLWGTAANPNFGGMLLVGLGCFAVAAFATTAIWRGSLMLAAPALAATATASAATSVVATGYGPLENHLGSLGVVGPTHMDYAGAIRSVNAVAQYVTRILEEQ